MRMSRFIQIPTLATFGDPARGTIAASSLKAIIAHEARRVLAKMGPSHDRPARFELELSRKRPGNFIRRLSSARGRDTTDATRNGGCIERRPSPERR